MFELELCTPAVRTACAVSSAAVSAALFNSCASCMCASTVPLAMIAQLDSAACDSSA